VALYPPHDAHAHARDQIRILAEGLLRPAPARVAADVQHPREPLLRAPRPHVHADRAARRAGDLRIPRARQSDRLREHGRLAGHQAGADLLVDDRRDTDPLLLDEIALAGVREQGRGLGPERARARDPGDVGDAVAEQRFGALALEFTGTCELEDPGAAELGDLLVACHPGEEVVDALGDGARGVAVQGTGAVELGKGHVGLPTGLQEPRTTSRVGSMRCIERSGRFSIRPIRSSTASKPMRWIGCSIVVSGGWQSADSGTLSNPITERSSGIDSPRARAAAMVAIAETSLAAKMAVGRSRAVGRARAASSAESGW